MIVIYNSRVVPDLKKPYYDSRVIIYDRKMFIRLVTCHLFSFFGVWIPAFSASRTGWFENYFVTVGGQKFWQKFYLGNGGKKEGFARESWSKEEGIIDHLSFPRLETLRRKKYFCQFFNSSENVIIILASRLNDVRIFSVRQTVLTTFIILRISR